MRYSKYANKIICGTNSSIIYILDPHSNDNILHTINEFTSKQILDNIFLVNENELIVCGEGIYKLNIELKEDQNFFKCNFTKLKSSIQNHSIHKLVISSSLKIFICATLNCDILYGESENSYLKEFNPDYYDFMLIMLSSSEKMFILAGFNFAFFLFGNESIHPNV